MRPRLALDSVDLDAVLAEAHVPSLMVALVHLTGNTDHLTEARRPVYEVLGDGQGGLKPDDVQAIRDLAKAAKGQIDADAVRAGLSRAGITLSDPDFAGLLTETIEHATRISANSESSRELDKLQVPRLELPTIADGVDLGSLYELAEVLAQQGVR
jgi:hypothetical protein